MKEKYQQGEAFCLMRYRCETCMHTEILWNSRDGVTPFSITCPECEKAGRPLTLSNGLMSHVDWDQDLCYPDYLPGKGESFRGHDSTNFRSFNSAKSKGRMGPWGRSNGRTMGNPNGSCKGFNKGPI